MIMRQKKIKIKPIKDKTEPQHIYFKTAREENLYVNATNIA